MEKDQHDHFYHANDDGDGDVKVDDDDDDDGDAKVDDDDDDDGDAKVDDDAKVEDDDSADAYRLSQYFPSATERRIKYDKKQMRFLSTLRPLLILSLSNLSCADLIILGKKYYSEPYKIVENNVLYHTFIEMPKPMAARFLAEEILNDKRFFEGAKKLTGEAALEESTFIVNFLQQTKSDVHVTDHRFEIKCRGEGQIPALATPIDYVAVNGSVFENGNRQALCPRGYMRDRKNTLCCVRNNRVSLSIPLVWNRKIETTVLESLKSALLKTIKLHAAKKVFISNKKGEGFEYSGGCRDGDILAHTEFMRQISLQLEQAVVEPVRQVGSWIGNVMHLKSLSTKIKKAAAKISKMPVIGQARAMVKLGADVLKGFNLAFINSPKHILRIIKKLLVETAYDFIVDRNLLTRTRFTNPPDSRREENSSINYRHEFSVLLTDGYKRYLAEAEAEAEAEGETEGKAKTKAACRDQLFKIFMQKYKEDESIYANMFESLGFILTLLHKVTYGVSDIVVSAINRMSSDVLNSAFEEIAVEFFYMDLDPSTDIFEYIISVFDMSEALWKDPLLEKNYPLKKWRQAIDSQILGVSYSKELKRGKLQEAVILKLLRENEEVLESELQYIPGDGEYERDRPEPVLPPRSIPIRVAVPDELSLPNPAILQAAASRGSPPSQALPLTLVPIGIPFAAQEVASAVADSVHPNPYSSIRRTPTKNPNPGLRQYLLLEQQYRAKTQ